MADFVRTSLVKTADSSVATVPSSAKTTGGTYFLFLLSVGIALRHFSDRDHSFVLTLGAGMQTLGFGLLLQAVKRQRTVAGLSSKTLEMSLLSLLFRLSSTLINEGYLPIDRSGDHVYQAFDIGSVVILLQLLWMVNKRHVVTYQKEHDTMQVWNAVPVIMAFSIICHGNLNRSWFFDVTWTIGMHLETISMLPQYWMFVQKGGEVSVSASHFTVCIVVSRALAFTFWYYAYKSLKPKKRDGGGPNIAGYILFASYLLQLILSADFMYHYFRSLWKGGKVVIPKGGCDV